NATDSAVATPASVPEPAARAVAAAPVTPVVAKPDTMLIQGSKRLAKVFSSMSARDAAKVLEHMADQDVDVILGYVGPRQAASIMAALPPERVAILSKTTMRGPSGGENKP